MPAAAALGSSALSAGASILGSQMQAKSAKSANKLQAYMWGEQMKRQQPFVDDGIGALGDIAGMREYFNTPIAMDQAALEKTPGYQFTQGQGLKSLQNAYAARGLGSSGAALKGASEYTTGLANKTYLDQYNVERQNRNDIFNRLFQRAGLGAGVANNVGAQSTAVGSNLGNNLMSGANAQAAGLVGAANQIGGGVQAYSIFNKLLNQGGGGSGNNIYGNSAEQYGNNGFRIQDMPIKYGT